MKFLARLRDGESMTELCREFEISRKTGYKFLKRFTDLGVIGLLDQRRVPERIAHRSSAEVVARIIALRNEHPTWGPKKLRDVLMRREPGVRFPAVSTVGEILKREGLITPRRRRVYDSTPFSPLSHAQGPNDVWCIDYKGQFRLRNGRYCYPLTLTDALSRYILACEGFDRISTDDVRMVLENVFRTYGMPSAIRFDGGPPFASTGLRRLSKLSVWWLRLGITLEQIEPASPQQNGRHERMHRTLKAETTRPPAANLLQQQERFDLFREVFNEQRPHEGINMRRPAEAYERSQRHYVGDELTTPDYPLHDLVATVSNSGHVRIPGSGRRGGQYFLANALAGQDVGLREVSDDQWLVSFLHLDLGIIDTRAHRFIREASEPEPGTTELPGTELTT